MGHRLTPIQWTSRAISMGCIAAVLLVAGAVVGLGYEPANARADDPVPACSHSPSMLSEALAYFDSRGESASVIVIDGTRFEIRGQPLENVGTTPHVHRRGRK
jgi:hypothetical protein